LRASRRVEATATNATSRASIATTHRTTTVKRYHKLSLDRVIG
jgi:hypothetical protein